MEILLPVTLAAVVIGFGVILWMLRGPKKEPEGTAPFTMIQHELTELRRALDEKLRESHEATKTQFSESAKIIRDITEKLTKLDEANRQVTGFGEQLKQLQDILQNPKRRGNLGEYQLETILGNVLPPGSYQMQYQFSDGTAVDAVVFYQDKIIPIDSKFSLENYTRILEATNEEDRKKYADALRKDLKIRIEETSKYIKPEEGTMQNALMFIPSEAIYYDLLINRVGAVREHTTDLIEFAAGKHVSIVSPTTFLVMLKMVLQGMSQIEFNRSAEEIRKNVHLLGQHLSKYDTYMQKIGNNLETTRRSYNTAYKELGKIDKDIMKIAGENAGIEPLFLEDSE